MTHEPQSAAEPGPSIQTLDKQINRLGRIIGQAARFPGDAYGLGIADKTALARMNPEAMRAHQIAALSRALIQAEMEPERWRPETWRRWALIAHGIALAGHNERSRLGAQLYIADVSESRVTKLLTARGEAFHQLIAPLLRLLASKEVAPNWDELGGLILNTDKNEARAEAIRMQIASRYFSEQARAARN